MSQPLLKGIRIIDHGIVYTGTAATTMLADMGAEVIRVESIGRFPAATRGNVARPAEGLPFYFGYADNDPGERPWDRWYQLHAINRNKYGITLELNQPEGVKVYKRLLKKSDFVMENFSQGTMERLGLGYDVLKEVKPDIIMISASGLGQEGPYKGYSTFGSNVDAISGMMSLRGYPGDDLMIRSTDHVWSDNVAAGTVAFAALTALHYRNKTGKGQFIDLSQAETFLPHMGEAIMDYTMNGRVAEVMGNREPSMAPHGCYRCRGSDKWVTIAVSSDEQWEAFYRVLGNPTWTGEERFSSMISRQANQDELDKLVGAWTIKHEPYEVMHILQGVGIPAGPVVRRADLYNDAHLKERGFFREITHRETGTHLYPGTAFGFSKTPVEVRIPANCLGEHNEYVFKELLGMTDEEIARLEEKQITGTEYLPGV